MNSNTQCFALLLPILKIIKHCVFIIIKYVYKIECFVCVITTMDPKRQVSIREIRKLEKPTKLDENGIPILIEIPESPVEQQCLDNWVSSVIDVTRIHENRKLSRQKLGVVPSTAHRQPSFVTPQ